MVPRSNSLALAPLALLFVAATFVGCPGDSEKSDEGASSKGKTKLVVYCGRSEALVGPIFEAFEEANPDVELDLRFNKTPALAGQVLAEGKECPADLVFFQDSGYLGSLAAKGLLQDLPEDLLKQVPERFRGKRWIGVSGRLRVLVISDEKVPEGERPQSLADLGDPKWKGQLGWAPGNSSFQAHLSHLRHTWGKDKLKAWLESVKANEPQVYPKNSPQVKAAAKGDISIGWVNHYYLHKLKAKGVANVSFPSDDGGNVLMVAGVGVRAGSAKAELATRLATYLVSKETQAAFAEQTFEYPLVEGVAPHADVTPLAEVKLSTVDQAHLADVEPTLELLRELGLQ